MVIEIKKYPDWKQAEDLILCRIEAEGYGFLVSFSELHDYMSMKKPALSERMTVEEHEKYQFQWMSNMEGLKTSLLENHDICLMNSRGDGYVVCTQDDQVTIAYSKRFKKCRNQLNQAVAILMHVNQELLSAEGSKVRLENLTRSAFVKQAMNKRVITNKKANKVAIPNK